MSIPQKEDTLIVEMKSAKSSDIKDLRSGEGKLFKRIAKTIEKFKESGKVGENVQPIIIIVKKKKRRSKKMKMFGLY